MESGEGIESSREPALRSCRSPPWNPVKELKAAKLVKGEAEILDVESGEGIERRHMRALP